MRPYEIRSKLSNLSRKLNTVSPQNDIKKEVEAIKAHLKEEKDTTGKDAVQSRREKTRTNHELGSSDYPVESVDETTILIPEKHIEGLRERLSEIKKELDEFAENVSEVDMDELSSSMTRTKEEVYGAKDMFPLRNTHGEPRFVQLAYEINRSKNPDEENVQNLEDKLERILKECRYVSESLSDVTVPDEETVKEEVKETRARRAEREMEEMKPYMDMDRILSEFDAGEYITPEELAKTSDIMTPSTAKGVIEGAMEVAGSGRFPDIEEVAEDTYKIVDEE